MSKVRIRTDITLYVTIEIDTSQPEPADRGEYNEYWQAYHAWYKAEVDRLISSLKENPNNPSYSLSVSRPFLSSKSNVQMVDNGITTMTSHHRPKDWDERIHDAVKDLPQIIEIVKKDGDEK